MNSPTRTIKTVFSNKRSSVLQISNQGLTDAMNALDLQLDWLKSNTAE